MKNRCLIHSLIAAAIMAVGISGWAAFGGTADGSWWGLFGGGILAAALITAWIAFQMAQRITRLQKDLAHETDRRIKVEKALAESSQRYSDFFSQSQVCMLIIDPDTHQVRDINQSALALIGAEKDQVVGRSCRRFPARHKNANALSPIRKRRSTTPNVCWSGPTAPQCLFLSALFPSTRRARPNCWKVLSTSPN